MMKVGNIMNLETWWVHCRLETDFDDFCWNEKWHQHSTAIVNGGNECKFELDVTSTTSKMVVSGRNGRKVVSLNPSSVNPTKWSTNFLRAFDHFVGLALKGLLLILVRIFWSTFTRVIFTRHFNLKMSL